MYPGNATDAEKLVEMADHAMYLAKKDGKNGYRIATESAGTQLEGVIEESIS
jgi:predicted signal transduction protein with EAL and GGDEF domain